MSTQDPNDTRLVLDGDLERIVVEVERELESLVASPDDVSARLHAIIRHVGALQGGLLAGWANGIKALAEYAGSQLAFEPATALTVAHHLQGSLPGWRELNRLAVEENIPALNQTHERMRAEIIQMFPRVLDSYPPVISPKPEPTPSAFQVSPQGPPQVTAPALKRAHPFTPPAPVPRPPSFPAPAVTNIAPPLFKRAAPVAPPVQPPQPPPAEVPADDFDLLPMLKQEIAEYLTDLTEVLRKMASNLKSESLWDSCRRVFHSIKGAAATVGVDNAVTPAGDAEKLAIRVIADASLRDSDAYTACIIAAQRVAEVMELRFDGSTLQTLVTIVASEVPTPVSLDVEDTPPDADLLESFAADANEQLETLEKAALRWEKNEDVAQQTAAARRAFHTIKGAANSIGLRRLGNNVHLAEELIEDIANDKVPATRPLFTFLLLTVDQLRAYLRALAASPSAPWPHNWSDALAQLRVPMDSLPASAPIPEAAPVEAQPAPEESADEEKATIRVEADKLYQLISLIGESVIDRNRLEAKLEKLAALQAHLQEQNTALDSTIGTFQKEFEFNTVKDRTVSQSSSFPLVGTTGSGSGWKGPDDGEFSELEFDRYDQFSILARSLAELSHDIGALVTDMSDCLDSFAADSVRFRNISRQLQQGISSMGLVPVSTLYPRLERAFRDATNTEGKEARLVFEGANAQLDKTIVDRVYGPLLHLLRNAVAHGIESPERREEQGKPRAGLVRLTSAQVSNQIVIQIIDDGAGIDVEMVRLRAISRGLIPANTETMTHEQVVHCLFMSGFSTKETVSSVAGRGIGLDVVRTEVENLNGSVDLTFESGKGSTWTLHLPLTLSISEAILAQVGGQTFAFPLNFIQAGLVLESAISRNDSGEFYQVGEEAIPVLRLGEILRLPVQSKPTRGLILNAGDRRSLLLVDQVLSRSEIVVKQLDSLTTHHPLLTGATIDAEGRVIPILNLPGLLTFAESRKGSATRSTPENVPEAAPQRSRVRVLIVDDSLSVRKVQERLLGSLGCEIATANDGLHALEKLREATFDIIFTDLEMPRLNGYELITEVRSSHLWKQIPIIVISSRSADKYITKAMTLGANSFLTKPFTEKQLSDVLQHHAGYRMQSHAV